MLTEYELVPVLALGSKDSPSPSMDPGPSGSDTVVASRRSSSTRVRYRKGTRATATSAPRTNRTRSGDVTLPRRCLSPANPNHGTTKSADVTQGSPHA